MWRLQLGPGPRGVWDVLPWAGCASRRQAPHGVMDCAGESIDVVFVCGPLHSRIASSLPGRELQGLKRSKDLPCRAVSCSLFPSPIVTFTCAHSPPDQHHPRAPCKWQEAPPPRVHQSQRQTQQVLPRHRQAAAPVHPGPARPCSTICCDSWCDAAHGERKLLLVLLQHHTAAPLRSLICA